MSIVCRHGKCLQYSTRQLRDQDVLTLEFLVLFFLIQEQQLVWCLSDPRISGNIPRHTQCCDEGALQPICNLRIGVKG